MADYKNIKGINVQTLDDNSSAVEGQVYFSNTDGLYRINKGGASIANGVWRSGGGLLGRISKHKAVGTLNDGMELGGEELGNYETGANDLKYQVLNYNGTTWRYGAGSAAQVRDFGLAGKPNSAVVFGGAPSAVYAIWNGEVLVNTNSLNTSRDGVGGCGATSTAALCAGGNDLTGKTEVWNGTNWSNVNTMNTSRERLHAVGTTTSSLGMGGNSPRQAVESWNGTNWTSTTSMSTEREYCAGFGTQNSTLAFGGQPVSQNVEYWNGSTWTSVSQIASQVNYMAGFGNTELGVACGGGDPSKEGTYEWVQFGGDIPIDYIE